MVFSWFKKKKKYSLGVSLAALRRQPYALHELDRMSIPQWDLAREPKDGWKVVFLDVRFIRLPLSLKQCVFD